MYYLLPAMLVEAQCTKVEGSECACQVSDGRRVDLTELASNNATKPTYAKFSNR